MKTIWTVALTIIFVVLFRFAIVPLLPEKLRFSRRSIQEYRADTYFRLLYREHTMSAYNKGIKGLHNELQKWRHEYKNNLIVLSGYISNGDTAEALAYIETIVEVSAISNPLISTNNTALDAVINTKLWHAKDQGIDVRAQSIYSESATIQIAANDLCSIIGNLLNNAIEACDRMEREDHHRFLTFKLVFENNNLIIVIENSYTGKISRFGKAFFSSKRSSFDGIGLKYVDTTIKKYEGYMTCEYDGSLFSAKVMLPMKTQ
jgi:sensor histidine kinase regulating citrate/malate metabolism